MATLGEDLPKVMAHVRDKLIPQYQTCGPAAGFAIALMRADLDRATKALAEGDLPTMIATYEALRSYKA